ncbi:pilus assembly protein PilM [Thiohalomonas denitrificans]|uniref:MSHA biogenesis protein MshI n=1 Tax=Thiohalomonas denitrificans TaxID=415747 RepID=A0A1G5QTS7_9GAMM|nr:pilus assembly protein PilM [Thiohalomonas denitrificans]SCZ64960.1 MSHA biogenesis protein MshI [Thiohalomonas denitrificans]
MLTLPWKKRRSSRGLAGLALTDAGIASARVLQRNDGAPRLVACQFTPARSPEQLPSLLRTLAEEQKLDRTISVIGQNDFNLLLVEAPEVDPTELKAAVRWRIKDLIGFHIDDAVIDVFDIPSQRNGRARMMYAVVAKTHAVRHHIDLLEGAGLDLDIIDIPELALRNLASILPEDETGVATLYLNPLGGMLTLTRQSNLYLARTLDIGVERLSRETVNDADESIPEGGEIGAEQQSKITTSLQRMFDSIVLEVQRSLDYYESHFLLPPVSGLVIAPTEKPIPHLVRYMADNLDIPVRMMDLNALLDIDQPLSDELQAQCLPAIGAALRREEKTL